jgi:hypothetical protein
MYDSTGVGWNAHMGFGTSVLLDALGPDSFCAPQSLAIYREIRLFEISRAALFQQSTILAGDRWLLFDQTHKATSSTSPTLLEEAFDLFLKLVTLHERFVAAQFLIYCVTNNPNERRNKKSHQTQKTAPSAPPPAIYIINLPTSTTPSRPQPRLPKQTSPSSTTTPCQSISPVSATMKSFPRPSISLCQNKRYSITPRTSSPGLIRLWTTATSPRSFCCCLCALLGIDVGRWMGAGRF